MTTKPAIDNIRNSNITDLLIMNRVAFDAYDKKDNGFYIVNEADGTVSIYSGETQISSAGGTTPPPASFDFANYDYWVNNFKFADDFGTALTQDFASSDVDTVNNTIDLGVDLDLDAPTGKKNANAIQFFFTTTGTLPTTNPQIELDTPYYMTNTGGDYTLWRQATQDDVAILTGASPDLQIFPVQGFARQDDSFIIDLIDGGTGTHTVTSRPIQQIFTDSIATQTIEAVAGANKNSWAELGTDVDGFKYIRKSPFTRHRDDSAYDFYAKQYRHNVTGSLANQRTIIQTHVVDFEQLNNIGNRKANAQTVNIDVANDYIVFDTSNAIKENGDLVRIKAEEGEALPTGLDETTAYYGRFRTDGTVQENAKTITLHTTRAGATGNTDKVDITGAGTGQFTVYCPERVSDYERWGFTASYAYNGYHNIMSDDRFMHQQGLYDLDSDVSNAGVFTNLSDADNGTVGQEKYIYVPPEAVRTRSNGNNFVSGYYWVGNDHKIYETESDANSNTNPITFTGTGIGDCKILNTDFVQLNVHVEQVQARQPELRVDPNKRMLITYLIDKNDPAEAFQVYYVWFDGVYKGKFVTNRTKQNFAATDSPAGLAPFMNSAEGHVGFIGNAYHTGFGTDTDAISVTDIDEINAGLIEEYGITSARLNKLPEIQNEPKMFFDGADVEAGDVIQLSAGFVTGYPKPAIAWQKYYGSVATGSAFSGTEYTVTASDATEGNITFRQVATNSEGSTEAPVQLDVTVTGGGGGGSNPAWTTYTSFEGRMKPDATKLILEDTDRVISFEEYYNGTASRTLTAAGTARPTYDSVTGKITFDGAANALKNTNPFLYSSGACTLVMVVDNIAAALADTMVSEIENGGAGNAFYSILQFSGGESPQVQVRNDAGAWLINSDAYDTNALAGKSLIIIEDTGTQFRMWIDGVEGNSSPNNYTRTGALTTDQFILGGRLQNNGSDRTVAFDFYDMVMFSGTLTVAEKNAVQTDIATDNGVTVSTIT